MKICPKCKAELDDSARFCLSCMTSLDKKEQIHPPVPKRRWVLVLLLVLVLGGLAFLCGTQLRGKETVQAQETTAAADTGSDWTQEGSSGAEITEEPNYGESGQGNNDSGVTAPTQGSTVPSRGPTESTTQTIPSTEPTQGTTSTTAPNQDEEKPTQTIRYFTYVDGSVTYVFQAGTEGGYLSDYQSLQDPKYLVLVDVQGSNPQGKYYIPQFVVATRNSATVKGIMPGAFNGVTNARVIIVPYLVNRIHDNALDGSSLTDFYIMCHAVYIAPSVLSTFSSSMTMHSNDSGTLDYGGARWEDIAASYGFKFKYINNLEYDENVH